MVLLILSWPVSSSTPEYHLLLLLERSWAILSSGFAFVSCSLHLLTPSSRARATAALFSCPLLSSLVAALLPPRANSEAPARGGRPALEAVIAPSRSSQIDQVRFQFITCFCVTGVFFFFFIFTTAVIHRARALGRSPVSLVLRASICLVFNTSMRYFDYYFSLVWEFYFPW